MDAEPGNIMLKVTWKMDGTPVLRVDWASIKVVNFLEHAVVVVVDDNIETVSNDMNRGGIEVTIAVAASIIDVVSGPLVTCYVNVADWWRDACL